MGKQYQITDPELGIVLIRINPRAKRFIVRIQPNGHPLVTIPSEIPEKKIKECLDSCRLQVKEIQNKITQKKEFNTEYTLHTSFLEFRIAIGTGTRFLLQTEGNTTTLLCPPSTLFDSSDMQEWIKKIITELLRKRAKEILPLRTRQLAEQNGLHFNSLKINTSKGRWGSCSTRKDINLSCSLMLLPEHLVDYVILHELCHTIEMNHSSDFWNLLNRFTYGKAHCLRKELRSFNTFF